MNRASRIVIGIFAVLMIGAAASAESKKIRQSDLPAAVQKTATQESAGGHVTSYWQLEEDGGVIYEVDLTIEGHAKGLLINPEGDVVVVQEDVPWDQLPPDAQSGIKRRAGAGKIGKAHSLSRDGKVVGYGANVDNHGHKLEVEVRPDGAPLNNDGSSER